MVEFELLLENLERFGFVRVERYGLEWSERWMVALVTHSHLTSPPAQYALPTPEETITPVDGLASHSYHHLATFSASNPTNPYTPPNKLHHIPVERIERSGAIQSKRLETNALCEGHWGLRLLSLI